MSEPELKPIEQHETELVPIGELYENPENPNKHPDRQITGIKGSMEDFGNIHPLVIDEDNMILSGHGRLAALQRTGTEEVSCIRVTGLSEEEKRALMIEENTWAALSRFDKVKLKPLLESVNLQRFRNVGLSGEHVNDVLRHQAEDASLFLDKYGEENVEGEQADDETRAPRKTDDGYVQYDCIMPVDGKKRLLAGLNLIKQEQHFDTQSDALLFLLDLYEETVNT